MVRTFGVGDRADADLSLERHRNLVSGEKHSLHRRRSSLIVCGIFMDTPQVYRLGRKTAICVWTLPEIFDKTAYLYLNIEVEKDQNIVNS